MASLQTMPTALSLFKLELTSAEKTVAGAEQAGMIRTMADFAKGAYNLEHPGATEYINTNDISPHATDAYDEVIGKGWTPLNLLASSPVLDRGAIQSGMLDDGFYINGNAAACVARCGDAIVLSFRGTNDNGKDGVKNPYDPNNEVHQDKDQWTRMPDHYGLLSPLINAFDAYVAANGIKKVYVTGHSMGGSMALEYMSHHSGSEYQAITFAATPFGQPWISWFGFSLGTERKDYSADSRITQIEVLRDSAAILFDQPNLLGDINYRPGNVVYFGGDKTLDIDKSNIDNHIYMPLALDYWGITSNHSMDYYRQITDSVDADSWTQILAGTDTKTVLLGGELVTGKSDFIVDGQLSGTNTSETSGSEYLTSIDFKVIYGGKGNDKLTAGSNNTLLLGGVGDDYLYGQVGNDSLVGGTGKDWLIGDAGSDTMEGGAGNDTLNGGTGDDMMTGGDGSDIYYVDNSFDTVSETHSAAGIGGTDLVYTTLRAYTLGANFENGRIITSGTASLTGNSLNNLLYAGKGNNAINGGAGTDTVSYAYGVAGTAGVKVSLATTAAQATGSSGTDTLRYVENLIGSNYADTLTGNASNNALNGGAGNDVLTGGLGADTLTGGTGSDSFDFNALSELGLSSTTRDTITDFTASTADKIDLFGIDANTALAGNQAFSYLGALTAFTGNATGKLRFDAAAHILYGSTDADTAAEFAIVLTGVSSLSAANFVL